jgi:pimeloyl-ACP methyl ester carboxylesterase
MHVLRHCTALGLTGSIIGTVAAQQPAAPDPVPGPASFMVFVGGKDVGREQVNLARSGSEWIISSTGRLGDLAIDRFEVKYTADWQPVDLRLELTQTKTKLQLATSFGVTTAINEITRNGVTNSKTDQISARTVVLPNNIFAGHEALAARLAVSKPGAEVPMYVAPDAEVKLTVKSITEEAVATPSGTLQTRKYALVVQNVGATFAMTVTIDDKSRLARLEAPSASLTVVRSDLAGVAVRPHTARNPTDVDVRIPANGFSIAGTLTTPPTPGRLRHPVVVLVPGSGSVDRDETVAGIPILSQLAGALAHHGIMVLRYDKRGVGQTGGRTETVTQQDYADDLIVVVRWLARRDDVDSKRLTVAGHSEGAAIAMLAAAREDRIRALVLMAATGSSGADLILEQQRHQLDLQKVPEAEKLQKIELQKQIQAAVVTGKGWESLPPEVRNQADTPWFRSLLLFDPATVMPRIKQPILIVQGDLDMQVPPHHADKLADLARARKRGAGPVDVVHLPGVNHLLARATTGEVQEYAQLKEKAISPEVATTIATWLKNQNLSTSTRLSAR